MPDRLFDATNVFYYLVRAAERDAQPLHHAFGWEKVTYTKNFIVVAIDREAASRAVLRSFGDRAVVLSIAQVKSAMSVSDVIIDQHFVPAVPAPAPKEP